MSERIVGVDPSLTSTGFAVITRTEGVRTAHHNIPGKLILSTATIKGVVPAGESGAIGEVHRVEEIVDQVCRSSANAVAVYIEGLALMSRTGKYAERAHLYYSILAALYVRDQLVTIVPPTTLKKRVTGSGRADKQQMLDTVRDAWSEAGWGDGHAGGRFDRSDATALAWVGAVDHGWDVPKLITGRAQLVDTETRTAA